MFLSQTSIFSRLKKNTRIATRHKVDMSTKNVQFLLYSAEPLQTQHHRARNPPQRTDNREKGEIPWDSLPKM